MMLKRICGKGNWWLKRFVPPKREIGYVEISNVPSGSGSHGNVPVFHDKKITRLYENLYNLKDKGLIFKRERSKKPFGLVTLNTRIFQTTMSVGIVVMQGTVATHVQREDE